MSNTLGDLSPLLRALSDNIDTATPLPSEASNLNRRRLDQELEAEAEREETKELEPILEEQPTMSDLDKLTELLKSSDEFKKLLKDNSLDVDVLLETMKKPQVHSPLPSTSTRQSMQSLQSSAIKQNNRLSMSRKGHQHAEQKTDLPEPKGIPIAKITIDGRALNISDAPLDHDDVPARLFDKLTRVNLDSKDRQAFVKYSTSWVLSKNNKLALYSLGNEDSGAIDNIRNLQSQLKKLRRHFESYDIRDVFFIVTPTEVDTSSKLVSTAVFDLFTDYQRLHVTQVANSNAWYQMYCKDSYIKENMRFSLDCLQANTEDKLWEHCTSMYEKYTTAQRGGPLMLLLLLKEIQDSSETAITSLLIQLKELKISSVTGENVNEVITTIRSTYDTLISVSTDTHDYVPSDFVKTVLAILQTSSVHAFNSIFEDEVKNVTRDANRHGGLPQWPKIDEIFQLATNTYRSMRTEWNTPVKPASYGNFSKFPGAKNETPFHLRDGYECFNCGKKCGCTLANCPAPRDEARLGQSVRAEGDRA